MKNDQKLRQFRELEAELFGRVETGFTAFATQEGAVGYNWKPDGPLLETLGLMALLEAQIARDCLQPGADGSPEYIEPEDTLFEPELELSTTAALRDGLCMIFPTVLVGYLLPKIGAEKAQRKVACAGQAVSCLGLLRLASFKVRARSDIFGRDNGLKKYTHAVLKVKARDSGRIKIVSQVDLLQAAGYADLVLGKTAELLLLPTDENDSDHGATEQE